MRKFVLLLSLSLVTVSACGFQITKNEVISVRESVSEPADKLPLVEDGPIKNVIFVIGDGTGLAQLYSGQVSLVGKEGWLNIQTMPVTGLVTTHAANRLITDSAAGATAYSCGVKTNNRIIGQIPDGRRCKTILEIAEENGLSTGLVATSTITHATPASYAAHIDSRSKQPEIAEQYVSSGVEVLLGGGLEFFIPEGQPNSSRTGPRNLISEFQNNGYDFVENAQELENSDADLILGLFSPAGMPSENRTPTLKEMTDKALEVLNRNDQGFFLMVEGSQIDWAGHGNDVEYSIREVADFDAAVKSVLDFAVEDGQTLVVLTADHETGGMGVKGADNEQSLTVTWTTDYHTGVPVPLMAYGPHAIQFTGWHDNIDVGRKVAEIWGIGTLPQIIE